MSLLKLWFIRNPALVSYSICMRQGSSNLSGSQSALACLCVCARARLGLREFSMVRRSARKQKLSQDMMDETLAQANHCFSLSANTKSNHPSTPKTGSVILPEMVNAVICPETGKSLKQQELITKLRYKIQWMRSTANEINQLYNTNTIWFLRRSYIPKGRKVKYGSFIVDVKDHKEEKETTRLTVGGDQIEYPGDKSTRTAGHTTANILIKGVISTQGAKFLFIDIKK
jgi:hypothetical protein